MENIMSIINERIIKVENAIEQDAHGVGAAFDDIDHHQDLIDIRSVVQVEMDHARIVSVETLSAYDLMNKPHTGEEIYKWCIDQMSGKGEEQTVAQLLLAGFWNNGKVYPRKDTMYKISPIRFRKDSGQMFIQLYKWEQRVTPEVTYTKNEEVPEILTKDMNALVAEDEEG